ncbi:HAD family hydrolase [Streptomyces prunicolor]
MTTGLAVLDLDGTLLQGFLAATMADILVSVPGSDVPAARAALAAVDSYQARRIDHDECAARFHDTYARAVRGLSVSTLRDVGAEAWKRVRGQLFPHARELVVLLRAQGLSPCLLSGSPQEAVRCAAADLGMDRAWGLSLATDGGGRCTGQILRAPARRGAKGAVLREVTAALSVDWARSFAMGDSPSDIDVLDMVGRPVAYEPDPELLPIAVERGWTVTDRRTVLPDCRSLWPDDSYAEPH